MTDIELAGDALAVRVRGMDRLWALMGRLEIPLDHVEDIETNPEVARRWWKGFRAPGTHVPGVITAGTFYHEGDRVFWDVRDPEKTVLIHLTDERYAHLIVEVEDPPAAVAAIRKAVDERREL